MNSHSLAPRRGALFWLSENSALLDRKRDLISFARLIEINWINKAFCAKNSSPEESPRTTINEDEAASSTRKSTRKARGNFRPDNDFFLVKLKHERTRFPAFIETTRKFSPWIRTIICFTNWISFLSQYWLFIREICDELTNEKGQKGTRKELFRPGKTKPNLSIDPRTLWRNEISRQRLCSRPQISLSWTLIALAPAYRALVSSTNDFSLHLHGGVVESFCKKVLTTADYKHVILLSLSFTLVRFNCWKSRLITAKLATTKSSRGASFNGFDEKL